ncbi:MAG: acyltransferase [Proteobacteria bacterium]|nr:acyltransferase [Pseudomonadota bacterium]
MSVPANTRSWIPELDGLRAIAVVLVLFSHFAPTSVPFVWRLADVGWVGVELFFVLSGFLITRILLATRASATYYRDFYLRRTLRIFPLYYAVLALTLVTMQLWNHGESYQALRQWGNPVWFWLYLGNVQMALAGSTPMHVLTLAAMWSLNVEEQYYLLFPLLVRVVRVETLVRILLAVLVASPLLRLLLWWLYPHNEYLDYMLLPCRFDSLAYGALLALWLREPLRLDRRVAGVAALGALVLVYGLYVTLGHGDRVSPFTRVLGYSLFPAAFACLLLWVILYRGGWQTRWLRTRPMRYIGKTSYAIYLLQGPVDATLNALLGRSSWWANDVFRFALICLVTFGCAALSWHFFEHPLLALKDRFAPRPGIAPAAP